MDTLREHIKQFTDKYINFLKINNLYEEMYKDFRTGTVTKKEKIFLINKKNFSDYMNKMFEYADGKSWILQGGAFSLEKIKDNLYSEWSRSIRTSH